MLYIKVTIQFVVETSQENEVIKAINIARIVKPELLESIKMDTATSSYIFTIPLIGECVEKTFMDYLFQFPDNGDLENYPYSIKIELA